MIDHASPLIVAALLAAPAPTDDWLLAPEPAPARVEMRAKGEFVLENGLVRRVIRTAPDAATVAIDDLRADATLLRAVRPEARLTIDGVDVVVGGLEGQPNHAYLTDEWLDAMTAPEVGFRYVGQFSRPIEARLEWARVRHAADVPWPPKGRTLELVFVPTDALVAAHPTLAEVTVHVHHALYDGLPLFSKWLTVRNKGDAPITVDRFTSEQLAVVEHGSAVEAADIPAPRSVTAWTDHAFGGFTLRGAMRETVHWVVDPEYATQVNYRRLTPCQLELRPTIGPAQVVPPGGEFESFRGWLLVHEPDEDRERRGLAVRRAFRTIAPWVTENPIMMHMRRSDPESVRAAIDQCAEVGFEMLILSFGSGFDVEKKELRYRAELRALAKYAEERGVEIGGYSLLSSRRVEPVTDCCVDPETGEPGHGKHGFCPALASEWGERYFDNLYGFYAESGFTLLEHDGSYPGDLDAVARPPRQRGVLDSRWVQWRIITDFYEWCRAQGVYLNVPDFYYLNGSNKCGMGYRETNWSLPRRQQHVHARQNIFDGAWEKTPSMGWMFVPLTEYHGGGPAATMEPLSEHLEEYDLHMAVAFGLGVQACYRGPRLFDTPEVRDRVKARVAWFKEHRRILEADLIHGRRADGRDLDWMLHVDPHGPRPGMLVVFNPLDTPRTKTLRVDLTYTGLRDRAVVRDGDGPPTTLPISRDHTIELDVTVPPRAMRWYPIDRPQ